MTPTAYIGRNRLLGARVICEGLSALAYVCMCAHTQKGDDDDYDYGGKKEGQDKRKST